MVRQEPLRYVTGAEEQSLHKCRCRAILVVRRAVVTVCRCGRRYAWSAGTKAKKTVVISDR